MFIGLLVLLIVYSFPSNRLKSFKYICATYLTVHLFLCADKTHCNKALSFEEEKNNYKWPFAETWIKRIQNVFEFNLSMFFLAGGRGHFWVTENILQSNYLNM